MKKEGQLSSLSRKIYTPDFRLGEFYQRCALVIVVLFLLRTFYLSGDEGNLYGIGGQAFILQFSQSVCLDLCFLYS